MPERGLERLCIAEWHTHVVIQEPESRLIELRIRHRQGPAGLPVEGPLCVSNDGSLSPLYFLGKLQGRFDGLRSRGAQEHHIEISWCDARKVLGQRAGVLGHEGDRDLVALLFLKALAGSEDAGVIVTKRE